MSKSLNGGFTAGPPKSSTTRKATRVVAGSVVATLAVTHVGKWEGLKLAAYRDIIGVPTACYGETRGIRMGMVFTKPECDEMFLESLQDFAARIEECVPPLRDARQTTPAFYVANLELAYNAGSSAYCKSTMARKVNAGDQKGACEELMNWVKAGGKKVRGLWERRKDTKENLCLPGRL